MDTFWRHEDRRIALAPAIKKTEIFKKQNDARNTKGGKSMGKKRKIAVWALLSFFTCLAIIVTRISAIGQETGEIVISVRDIETGYSLPAFIFISKVMEDGSTGPVIDSFQASLGEVLKSYPAGKYIIELKMEGYKPIKSWFVIEAGEKTVNRFMLSPVESKERKLRLKAAEVVPSNMAVVSGYITDDETGQPLEGVHIVFEKTNIETYSDQRGYYKISIPIKENMRFNDREIKAIQETIIFSLIGYKTIQETNVLITAGHSLKKNITMFKGKGEIIHNRTHPMLLNPDRKSRGLNELEDHILPPLSITTNLEKNASTDQIIVKQPPPSIRVGFSSTWGPCCYPSECTNTITYTLEDYVRLGWGDEWIPSWGVHALRAGAVAYRSYGAYHVYHPRGSNHDICSSGCCQKFDPDNDGLTSKKTAGIMLQKGGNIFFAEYSAENNNLCSGGMCSGGGYTWTSCGDGYVGRPPSWPCLYDPVRKGETLNGHGGGMSQWGTYSWDLQGKTWVWMVNHYYNANDGDDGPSSGQRTAHMTSPLEIINASPTPNSVAPGQTFTINIDAQNYAGLPHEQVMIGASLYSNSTGYINDPTNDKKVTLYSGTNNVSRNFRVPSGTPAGNYDLYIALWLDIDENGTINSNDLVVNTKILYSAVTVTGQNPTISGYVRTEGGSGISGVTLSFSNGGGSTTTNSNGYYSKQVPYGWSGTVTPSKSGYTFSPPSRSYSNVTSNRTNQNYTGYPRSPHKPMPWLNLLLGE